MSKMLILLLIWKVLDWPHMGKGYKVQTKAMEIKHLIISNNKNFHLVMCAKDVVLRAILSKIALRTPTPLMIPIKVKVFRNLNCGEEISV